MALLWYGMAPTPPLKKHGMGRGSPPTPNASLPLLKAFGWFRGEGALCMEMRHFGGGLLGGGGVSGDSPC